jgi:glycosyltransferase involved in cell wall biosynthesis
MRIVHVVSAEGWGGMEARTLETALWQANHGHEVLVVGAPEGATLAEARRRGLAAHAVDFEGRDKVRTLGELRGRLRRHGASVIDFHTNRSFAVGLIDLCPLVRSRHNLRKKPPTRRGLPKTFPFDRIIVTSEAERGHLLASGAARAERIAVVGEWAEERFFAPESKPEAVSAGRARLGVPQGDLVIGACAMLRGDNAFDELIRATARLRARGLSVTCLVVGGPPEARDAGQAFVLRRLARDLGVESAVRFLGHRDDVPELFDLMDVAAVVSRHTAQTRVGPEAAARGRPVVGFQVGALGEAVRHGETGVLVPLGDADGFAAALETLLVDRIRREVMSAAAARHARLNFRLGPKMEQTLQAYRDAARAPFAFPRSALGVHPQSIVEAR